MAGVLVIHCSSSVFQAAFQDFLHNELQVREYALLANPGGAQCLTLGDYLPKFAWAGWRWTKFLVDIDEPDRIVLLGHENCRWYRDPRFAGSPAAPDQRQLADLRRAASACIERFPRCQVSTYFGRKSESGVRFEQII